MPGHHDLTVLDEATCWALLGAVRVARVGLDTGGRIDVLPVNHVVHDGRVCWRSGAGTKLGAAAAETEVALEADRIDEDTHAGWSVVVHGRARIVTDGPRLEQLHELAHAPWTAADQKLLWVEVVPTRVSGRRLG